MNDCAHVHLPQGNEPTLVTCDTLDSCMPGTHKVIILRHELLTYLMNTQKHIFIFPLLGANIFSHEADSSVSAGICKNFTELLPRLVHCLGSLGTFTFLWLSADNDDYVLKFS